MQFYAFVLSLFCLKIVIELSKFEKSGLLFENSELENLKKELAEMVISKESLQSELSEMVRQHQTNQEKITSLLSNNSRLVMECDALAVTVMTQNGDLANIKKSKKELETGHKEVVKQLTEENENLKKELDETQATLGQLEEESIRLFEEGYRECWGRGEARGLDMESNKFETYLGELKEKIKDGVQEAEKSTRAGAD